MNKHTVILAIDEIYQRIKCQGFVPERDKEELTRAIDEFVRNGGSLDEEILKNVTAVLGSLLNEGIHLKNDKDKQNFVLIHEHVVRCMLKIPIHCSDEKCG